MEVPQQKSAPDLALSPARVLGGIQRPCHLSGFGFGSPERAASSSPVTTLTQTMHNLAGLGRYDAPRVLGVVGLGDPLLGYIKHWSLGVLSTNAAATLASGT